MNYLDLTLELLKKQNQDKELITIRARQEIFISENEMVEFNGIKDIHAIKSFNEIYIIVENAPIPPLKFDTTLYNKITKAIYGIPQ